LLLILLVSGIFFILEKNQNNLLRIKKQNLTSSEMKNILLTLMENYEEKLLNLRNALEVERTELLNKLSKTQNKAERNIILNNIKKIEKMQKKANDDLANIVNERTDFETQMKIKMDMVSELKNNNEKIQSEIFDLKVFWDNYINGIKESIFTIKQYKNDKDRINREFSKDYGKNYIYNIFKEMAEKENLSSNETELEQNYKYLKNNYEILIKNMEEICIKLSSNNEKLMQKINESKNKNNETAYIKILKETAIEILNEKVKGDSTNTQEDIHAFNVKGTNEEFVKLMSEKEMLEKDKKSLETNINSLKNNIKTLESNIGDKEREIELLLDQSNINGYFIFKNNKTLMMINRKKENEIISIGTFTVYDKNKNIVSKIYLSKQGQTIIMTKVPGYNNPKPGNWF